ncbi:MAG: hypothetical protein CVU38_03940 [Chloroflexi bacterium HGW-Chloroflexi-1]|nr:MAG: hypothetical protein CVU38_03940 [Chloroflexi bacterium HGW-Chloroflexi-1]
MNGQRMLIGVLIVGLLLSLAVGLIQAQGPAPDDDTPAGNEPEAALDDVVPIQGRLTDASGNPRNGNYSIIASIYDVAAGGVARCSDTDTVAVTNELFNMNVDSCTASDIDGDQLYLGIKVGADAEMTPRQPIFAAPYAWTVRPGAIIKGADSYVFVPGMAMVKNTSGDSTRWDMLPSGAVKIYRGGAVGNKTVYFPVTLPSVLYGQPMKVTSMTIFYKCQDGTKNYIDSTFLYKQTNVDTGVALVVDYPNRTSNTAATYDLTVPGPNNVLSGVGVIALHLSLVFVDDTNYIEIGAIRFTIDHNY